MRRCAHHAATATRVNEWRWPSAAHAGDRRWRRRRRRARLRDLHWLVGILPRCQRTLLGATPSWGTRRAGQSGLALCRVSEKSERYQSNACAPTHQLRLQSVVHKPPHPWQRLANNSKSSPPRQEKATIGDSRPFCQKLWRWRPAGAERDPRGLSRARRRPPAEAAEAGSTALFALAR